MLIALTQHNLIYLKRRRRKRSYGRRVGESRKVCELGKERYHFDKADGGGGGGVNANTHNFEEWEARRR